MYVQERKDHLNDYIDFLFAPPRILSSVYAFQHIVNYRKVGTTFER